MKINRVRLQSDHSALLKPSIPEALTNSRLAGSLRTIVILLLVGGTSLAQGITLRFVSDSALTSESSRWLRVHSEDWARKTGNQVIFVEPPLSGDRWIKYQTQPDMADVYMIENLWVGVLARISTDLRQYFSQAELAQFFPQIIETALVDKKLTSLPLYGDVGVLHYRSDLLIKYGYSKPPSTWVELELMAQKIQAGERQGGNQNFWGFVFQGNSNESLTCNALEWIYSFGGDPIIKSDGTISINNPNAKAALGFFANLVGKITPPEVTSFSEEESRALFQAGNVAFMRNWPYAYQMGQNSSLRDKIGVTVLPRGPSESGRHAATLGSWNLMISHSSSNPKVAADLVRYLASYETQKDSVFKLGRYPTRPALYEDKDVLTRNPIYKEILRAFENAIGRPVSLSLESYYQVSGIFSMKIHEVISGRISSDQAMLDIEDNIRRITTSSKNLPIDPVDPNPPTPNKLPLKRTDVYALVLGIGSYQSNRIPKLNYAVSDAQQFAKALEANANIPTENITTYTDTQATKARAEAKIAQLAGSLKATDTLIIYFSGHGAPSDKADAMLVLWDTDPELLNQTALTLTAIKDSAKSAGRVLLILDACFSGENGSKSVTAPGSKPFGLQVKQPQGDSQFAVLASSGSSESSYESPALKGGYFTYYLLEALRGAVTSPNGQATLGQIYEYVQAKVSASVRRERNASQVPQLSGSSLSGWVFAQDRGKIAQQNQNARLQKLGELQRSGEISEGQFDKLADMISTNQEHPILKAFLDGELSKQTFLNRLRAGLIPGVPAR